MTSHSRGYSFTGYPFIMASVRTCMISSRLGANLRCRVGGVASEHHLSTILNAMAVAISLTLARSGIRPPIANRQVG